MKKDSLIEFTKILVLLLVTGLFIFATKDKRPPANALQKLIDKYYSFHKEFPQQKIYIQTDKPYYINGDEMYGKVYLINENRWGFDSVRSKKIYVELINEENKVVAKTIVNGIYGSLNFSFQLPNSMADGNYILRAYTSWMIGFKNAENIFRSYIHIFNKTNQIASAVSFTDSTLSSVTIQLKDPLRTSFAKMPVNYQLISRTKLLADSNITTNEAGKFSVNVSSIPKDNLNETFIKIKTGKYEKLLRLPFVNNSLDVQFLPEGGYLVNGVENNVAFKALDSNGRGTEVHGFVKDDKGDTVCNFESTHLGMGKFEFIPGSGFSYTAYVRLKNGKELSFPFSPTNNYAYQLSVVKRSNDTITVRVALGDSLYKKNKSSYIIVTSHGGVYFTSHGSDMYEEKISLDTVPEGIAQLTLFDSAMQPVSERLIYVHHPEAKVIITANKDNYSKREKVTINLKTVDTTGRLLKGMYSVSVTDDHVVEYNESDPNIKTHLLLSPYLKGYIEQPGFYFENDDSVRLEDLDLVMLTHGWSRFTWNDIQNDNSPLPATDDSSLSLSGRITTLKNDPAVKYSVTLLAPSDNAYIGTRLTDENGEFRFTGIDFTDTTQFIVQVKDPKGRNEEVNVLINPAHFPLTGVDRSFLPDDNFPAMVNGINFYKRFMYDSLEENQKAKLLKEVIVSKKIKKLNYDESKRVSPTSYVILPEIIAKYGNGNVSLQNLLQMVPGYTGSNGQISFFGLNGQMNSAPLIIVDGVEGKSLDDISPSTVSFIEVLRGGEAAIYGMRGANGAIVIHTKTGSQMNMTYMKQKGIKAFNADGYQVEKNFYSPKYETDESLRSNIPDERTTIYWNGNVNTDSKSPATLSFYTADMPTTYTLTIEGIAENGELIHETFPINRTKK